MIPQHAVTFFLPRRRLPVDGTGPGADKSDAGGAAVRQRILVVDDDEAVCEMMKLVLIDEGYDVVTARHGIEAMSILRAEETPDLIILDLMMPVMNGWAVWDELQANADYSKIPVIIFTATGLRQGAVGSATVLSKTTDAEVLLGTINRMLRGN